MQRWTSLGSLPCFSHTKWKLHGREPGPCLIHHHILICIYWVFNKDWILYFSQFPFDIFLLSLYSSKLGFVVLRKDCVLNKERWKWKALNMNIFVCDYWVGTEGRGQSLECRSEPGSKLRESHYGGEEAKNGEGYWGRLAWRTRGLEGFLESNLNKERLSCWEQGTVRTFSQLFIFPCGGTSARVTLLASPHSQRKNWAHSVQLLPFSFKDLPAYAALCLVLRSLPLREGLWWSSCAVSEVKPHKPPMATHQSHVQLFPLLSVMQLMFWSPSVWSLYL